MINSNSINETYDKVERYYGKILNKTQDLLTSACTTSKKPPNDILNIIKKIPLQVIEKYYGCGNPLPFGIENLNILDLGSGSGRDCYILIALTGPNGLVTGIDMTSKQIDVAKENISKYINHLNETLNENENKYTNNNLKFIKGYIEYLNEAGIKENSMDLVITNCVVNLSPNKNKVIQQVYNVLKEGGEFQISDVFSSRRLSVDIQNHEILLGECIGGAIYIEDFIRLCSKEGFQDIRMLEKPKEIYIKDEKLKKLIGEARFFSITFRCFKLPSLESVPPCEDYGQFAYYNGNMKSNESSYKLDEKHIFEKNRRLPVCGNTAKILRDTWLNKYFTVIGDESIHYGKFDCSLTLNNDNTSDATSCSSNSSVNSSCC